MTPDLMTEEKARSILGANTPTSSTPNSGNACNWYEPETKTAVLNGRFKIEELEALAWWMKNMLSPDHDATAASANELCPLTSSHLIAPSVLAQIPVEKRAKFVAHAADTLIATQNTMAKKFLRREKGRFVFDYIFECPDTFKLNIPMDHDDDTLYAGTEPELIQAAIAHFERAELVAANRDSPEIKSWNQWKSKIIAKCQDRINDPTTESGFEIVHGKQCFYALITDLDAIMEG